MKQVGIYAAVGCFPATKIRRKFFMKKLIAILAVFAFMTAALFAQDAGTWTIGGDGRIGTRIDFMNLFNKGVTPTSNHANAFGRFWGDGFDNVRANIDVNYTKGAIKVGLGFNQQGKIGTSLTVTGDNFNFEASQDLVDLFGGRGGATIDGTNAADQRGKLWGNYNFQVLNGILLEVGVVGKDDPNKWGTGSFNGDVPSHNGNTAADYLLVDVSPMAGLNFGMKLPKLFSNGNKDFMDDSLRHIAFGVRYSAGALGVAAQFGLNGYKGDTGSNRLFIGATYQINDQMSVNFDFKGLFGKIKMNGGVNNLKDKDKNEWEAIDLADLQFGLQFAYNASPLYARLRLIYFNEVSTYGAPGNIIDSGTGDLMNTYFETIVPGATSGNLPGLGIAGGKFRINPLVQYKVIPESLLAELGVTLDLPLGGFTYFNQPVDKDLWGNDDYPKPTLRYVITPALYFNFLGTGTSDNPGTGMRIRWNVEGYAEQNKHVSNYLDITFRWSF
jgi:hypothetical protein